MDLMTAGFRRPTNPTGNDTGLKLLHDPSAGKGEESAPLLGFEITQEIPAGTTLRVGILVDGDSNLPGQGENPNTATYTLKQTFGGTATATSTAVPWTGESMDVVYFDMTNVHPTHKFVITATTSASNTVYAVDFEQVMGITFDTGTTGPDETAPTVSALAPTHTETGVNPSTNLSITFNEDVAFGTGNITLRQSGGGEIESFNVATPAVELGVSGDTVTINPTADLAASTTYYIEIDATAIDDLAGNSFAGISGDGTWSFTTGSPDTTAPSIDTLSPTNGAGSISPSANLVITFDEDIVFGSGQHHLRESGGAQVENYDVASPPANLTLSGNTLTIDPSSSLSDSTTYYVEIDSTAIDDLAGNSFAGISGDSTWSFTTGSTSSTATILHDGTSGSAVITPTNGTVFAGQGSSSNYYYGNLFGDGITKVDAGDPTTWTHVADSFSAVEGWLSNNQLVNSGGASAINFVDLDLGGTYQITAAHIWNWNATNQGGWSTDNVTLIFSTNSTFGDGDDSSQALTLTDAPNVGTASASSLYTGEHFTLTPVAGVTHIRVVVDNGTRALSELAFSAAAPAQTYSVTYDGNVSDGGVVPEDGNAYEADDTVTVSGNTGSLTKSGYSFGGWNTASDGSEANYLAGESFTITDDVTLYARWIPTFGTWISGFNGVGGQTGLTDDPDGDGDTNAEENYFGTHPGERSSSLSAGAVDTSGNTTFTFSHPINDPPAPDLSATYIWSKDLNTFYTDGNPDPAGTTVTFVQGGAVNGFVTVTATVEGTPVEKLFIDIEVTQE
jgi:uncharacterized repeat protein (TIGR02543 family)